VSGVLVGVAVAGYNPVKTFIATGHTTVLANVAEWSDAVNLLLPANWSPRNPPVLHLREEAVKNLQTATVELLVYARPKASKAPVIAAPRPVTMRKRFCGPRMIRVTQHSRCV
jgi:hypothetical protein